MSGPICICLQYLVEIDSPLARQAWRLRFGDQRCGHTSRPFLTIQAISKILSLPKYQVSKLLIPIRCPSKYSPASRTGERLKLTHKHIAFLTDQANLQRWASKSLQERAVIFHRQFPDLHISASTIQKLYAKLKVKKKVIAEVKEWPQSKLQKYAVHYDGMVQFLKKAESIDDLIVFVDEAIFSTQTMPKLSFSSKCHNITYSSTQKSMLTIAVVAGISRENGLEAWLAAPRSIKSAQFVSFVEGLRSRHQNQAITIFFDNCRVHHSKTVKAHLALNGIKAIYNVPYSPQYNPIEHYWSLVKYNFKKMKLQALAGREKVDYGALLELAKLKIEKDTIKSLASKTYKTIY